MSVLSGGVDKWRECCHGFEKGGEDWGGWVCECCGAAGSSPGTRGVDPVTGVKAGISLSGGVGEDEACTELVFDVETKICCIIGRTMDSLLNMSDASRTWSLQDSLVPGR